MTPKAATAVKRLNTRQMGDENSTAASEARPAGSGIFIKEVRIRNFRCLLSVDVELDKLTVLIGQNNSGKTSFLNALFAAIGAGQRIISNDDILLLKGEVSVPKDRAVVIDILIKPTDDQGKIIDVFPSGSPWLELWGNGVVQDDNEHDLVAIRTSFKWNTVKGEYALERRFLKDWQPDGNKWEESKPVEKIGAVTAQQIEPLALYLLDANREIVESSEIFSHIETHLKDFHVTLSCDEESIAIAPLARHLRDLSRGMDVVLSTRGAPPFSLNQQGMGTRSLGTFFTFWAFTTWRQKQAESDAVHPMMALEEPETH